MYLTQSPVRFCWKSMALSPIFFSDNSTKQLYAELNDLGAWNHRRRAFRMPTVAYLNWTVGYLSPFNCHGEIIHLLYLFKVMCTVSQGQNDLDFFSPIDCTTVFRNNMTFLNLLAWVFRFQNGFEVLMGSVGWSSWKELFIKLLQDVLTIVRAKSVLYLPTYHRKQSNPLLISKRITICSIPWMHQRDSSSQGKHLKT